MIYRTNPNMLYNPRINGRHRIMQSILLVLSFSGTTFSDQRRALSMSIPGDIMLVGLFPVHSKGEGNDTCGQLIPDRGIQRLEAMLYSLDIINKNNIILPNITLGATIFDTCSTSAYALKLVMDYIRSSTSYQGQTRSQCSLTGSDSASRTGSVAAVVGASYSDVSLPLASLLRLFKIPQVSYASTSPWLSDKAKYDYFVRTVPSGQFQSRVLVDIVTYFNWSYVSTVASEGEFGEAGIEFFQQEARRRGICLAETLKVPAYHTDKDVDVVIDKLLSKRNARVVVIFAHGEYIREILNAATRRNLQDEFTWLACDSWGLRTVSVGENQEVAEGALTVVSDIAGVSEFNDYFLGLDPLQYTRNPWFQEYWAMSHDCRWGKPGVPVIHASDACTGNETVNKEDHVQERKVQFIYDAVLTVALAIDALIKDECKGSFKDCDAATKIDGEKLLQDYILKSKFDDGYGRVVEFDKNGDTFGNYLVINYQLDKTTNSYVSKVVGTWRSTLTVDIGAISWAGGSTRIPVSSCSRPCEPNEIKEVGEDGDTCCWVCIPCKPWQYLADEFTCADCGEGLWPHPHRRSCYALPLQHMTFDTVYALVPMALSAFGTLTTIFIMVIFMCYNNTPVVMGTGRELSYLMLSGCLFCYLMTVVLILKPSTLVCAAQRFSVGVSLTLIYSSLLTKTNCILRIFENAKTSETRASFISQRSQLAICMALLALQLVFGAIWLLLKPPGTRLHYEGGKRDAVVLKCLTDDVTFLVSLVYNALLIATCTIYAIKTRNVPDNFNESKFIGFAMYTTCVIWVAFVPIYFGTMNSFELQRTALCMCTSLSATVVLVCLFTPKVFIILLRPHRNVHTQATASQNTPSSS